MIIVLVLVSSAYAVFFEGEEYDCDGELFKENGIVKCRQCAEGFTPVNGTCVLNIKYRTTDPIEHFLTNVFRLIGNGDEMAGLGLVVLFIVLFFTIRNKGGKKNGIVK